MRRLTNRFAGRSNRRTAAAKINEHLKRHRGF
jgi:hypothetical protein